MKTNYGAQPLTTMIEITNGEIVKSLTDLTAECIQPQEISVCSRFITKRNGTKHVQQWIIEILFGVRLRKTTINTINGEIVLSVTRRGVLAPHV